MHLQIIYFRAGGFGLWFPELSNRFTAGQESVGICDIIGSSDAESIISESYYRVLPDCEVVLNDQMYTYNMALGLTYTVSFILLGLGLNKISLKKTLTSMLLMGAVCAVLIQHIRDSFVLLCIFCLLIISAGVSVPLVNATAVDLFPTHLRGMAISVTILIGRMGTVTGANSLGFLLDMDCGTTFYGTAFLALSKKN